MPNMFALAVAFFVLAWSPAVAQFYQEGTKPAAKPLPPASKRIGLNESAYCGWVENFERPIDEGTSAKVWFDDGRTLRLDLVKEPDLTELKVGKLRSLIVKPFPEHDHFVLLRVESANICGIPIPKKKDKK